jgi:hypothetical protein
MNLLATARAGSSELGGEHLADIAERGPQESADYLYPKK